MATDLAELRTVADFQFGSGAGEVLFPEGEDVTLTRTKSGRPRQIHGPAGRLATYGTDGRFRLGIAGGQRLHDGLDGYHVVVGDESEPHVRDGRNAFAKFVIRVDEVVRPRDEVLVEHVDGHLLAVGRAELSGQGMLDFDSGVAVKVREGADTSD